MAEQTSRLSIVVDTNNAEQAIQRLTNILNRLEGLTARIGGSLNGLSQNLGRLGGVTNNISRTVNNTTNNFNRMGDTINNTTTIINNYNNSTSRAANNTDNLNRKASSLTASLASLKGAMAGFLGTLGVGSILQTADAMQSLNNQIKLVTGSTGEMAAVQAELERITMATYGNIQAMGTLYVGNARALANLNKTQEEALKFTEAVSYAMAVGGKSAQEQASALYQLGQAMQAGVVQGDEFRSIAENAPILLDLVSKSLGVTRGEVKKLASDGEITAEVMYNALSGSLEQLKAQAQGMTVTMGQAFNNVKTQWQLMVDALVNGSSGISAFITQSLQTIANNFQSLLTVAIGGATAALFAYTAGLAAAAASHIAFISSMAAANGTIILTTAALRGFSLAVGIAAAASKAWTIANTPMPVLLAQIATTARAATASLLTTSTATVALTAAKNALKGALINVVGRLAALAGVINANPLMALAVVIGTAMVATHGLKGAFDSLSDAIRVVGSIVGEFVSVCISGIQSLAKVFIGWIDSFISGSSDGTGQASGFFATFFGNTAGGFVGLLQIVARTFDLAGVTIASFVDYAFQNIKRFGIAVGNVFKSIGNAIIAAFEGAINFVISGVNKAVGMMNSLIRSANSIAGSLGAAPIASEMGEVGKVSFGRMQATSVGGDVSFSATMQKWADRNLGNGLEALVNRHYETVQAAKVNTAAHTDLNVALQGATDAAKKAAEADEAGGKAKKAAGDAAKEAAEKMSDAQKAAEKLAQAFKNALSGLKRSIAMVGVDSEFERWKYDLSDVTHELYGLDSASKAVLLDLAKQLDIANVTHEANESITSLRKELDLLDDDSPVASLNWDLKHTQKYAGLAKDKIDELVKRTDKLHKAKLTKSANESIYDSITQIDRQLALLNNDNPVDALNWDLKHTKKYANASAEAIDKLKEATQRLYVSQTEQKFGDLKKDLAGQSPVMSLIQQYQEKMAVIDEFEKLHTDKVAEAEEARRNLRLATASSAFGALAGLSKEFLGEQSRVYRALFAVQQSFAFASAGINMYKALSDAMAQGATLPQKLTAYATVAAEFGKIMAGLKGVTMPIGQAHDGIMSVPKSGTWNLEKGERVLPQHTAQALDKRLAEGTGAGTVVNITVNVDAKGNTTMSANDANVMSKQMAHAIQTVVIDTLRKERRQGGMYA